MQNEPLIGQVCVSCRPGMPTLTRAEIDTFMPQTPEWALSDDGKWIRRDFKFKNFMEALNFLNKVAGVAETEGHHPDYRGGWGHLTLELTTHAIQGLSKNDFILAAKINALLS